MKCGMCHEEVHPKREKNKFLHVACKAKTKDRFLAKECVYCGERMDDGTISSTHCSDAKYVGYP